MEALVNAHATGDAGAFDRVADALALACRRLLDDAYARASAIAAQDAEALACQRALDDAYARMCAVAAREAARTAPTPSDDGAPAE
jgi:hypothetical protein